MVAALMARSGAPTCFSGGTGANVGAVLAGQEAKEERLRRRDEVELAVSFGPAATPVLPTAVEFARRHADAVERRGERTWIASFRLGRDEERYGRAVQLVCMVHGWRSTTFDIGGSPEPNWVVLAMLSCAREWLRMEGRCRAAFGHGLPAKCRGCPLLDPEWALESCPPAPTFTLGDDGLPYRIVIPDVIPPEWEAEPPERA
jgi:hypothetical protein